MEREAVLARVAEVVANPVRSLEAWRGRTGGKVLGCLSCMPPFAPEEMVHAAGMLPAGIWGAEIPVSRADAKIQSFACSVARTALELALRDALAVCDGFLFPFPCDAFQNLSEIWKLSVDRPCFQLVVPRKVDAGRVRVYLAAELRRLRGELAALAGTPVSDGALWGSIRVYNENRRLMREVDRARAADPDFLTARQMLDLLQASSFLSREEHSSLVRDLLAGRTGAEAARGKPDRQGPAGTVPILLTGVMPRPVAIVDMLEQVGLRVTGDDMGMGSLYYSIEVPESGGDPLQALAEGYTGYPACSTLHDPAGNRGAALIRRARETGAQAVLVFATKFCEPEYFDVPGLKEDLEKEGLPLLLLETELGMGDPGPIRTRVEAFVETLRGRGPA